MVSIQDINQINSILPTSVASIFYTDQEGFIGKSTQWIKTVLNWADYIPGYIPGTNHSVLNISALIRMTAATGYIAVAILKFGYNSFIQEKSDAKKKFDRELAKGFAHFLRGGLIYATNNFTVSTRGSRTIKEPWHVTISEFNVDLKTAKHFFTAFASAGYDLYVSQQDKKEKWFNFYA